MEKARTEDKPAFLRIGDSACRGCRVMAQESVQDAEAAVRAAHRDHVSVKADRGERPDVDAGDMAVCDAVTDCVFICQPTAAVVK